uniref:Conotoxin n=1 Tax=Conus andremenezi TaxID=1077466 RepID=A0A291C238_9COND|nr:conotoxin [Conus andremenezi]
MKSAVFMMALSMSISIVFTKESAIPPGTRCSDPKGTCPFTDGTCGAYYRSGNANYCFRVCKCKGTNDCLIDEDHALVRGNKTFPSTVFTCKPIREFRECKDGETALVYPQPGLIRQIRCLCSRGWRYEYAGNGKVKCLRLT